MLQSAWASKRVSPVAAVKRTFKWSASLNEAFKVDFAEDAALEIKAYDNLKVKDGKLCYFAPAFDPAEDFRMAA